MVTSFGSRAEHRMRGQLLCIMKNLHTPWPNERAAGKGGIPALLHAGRARPALPEHEC